MALNSYLPVAGEGEIPQWLGTYAALVINNDDPLGVGRLQLQVPMVLGSSVSTWAVPSGSYFQIPGNNTVVSCVFLGGDPSQPAWSGPLDISPIVEAAAPPTITYSSTAPANPRVNDVWFEQFTDSLGNTITAAAQVWTFHPLTSTFSWVVQSAVNSDNPTPGSPGSAALGAGALTSSVIGNLGTTINKNPFFSGASLTGWTTSGAGNTASVVKASTFTAPPFGGYAAQVVFVTAGAAADKFNGSADRFGVVVGNRYACTAWVFSSNAVTVNFGFEFRNAAGSPFSTLTSAFAVPSNTWTLVNSVQTAPANSVTADLTFWTSAVTTLSVQAAQAYPQIPGIVDATIITGAVINGGIFNGTNWIENSSGSFLYSGTPASGNLTESVAPTSGTDGFGNAYQAGFTAYGSPSGYTQLAGNVANPLIKMVPTGATHVGFAPQIQAGATNPGAANEILFTQLRSGSPSGSTADSTAIALQAPANDASTVAAIQFFVGNTAVMACEPTNVTFTEEIIANAGIQANWTNASFGAGFAANAGDQAPRYRLEPMGGGVVRLDGVVATTAATAANATMFTLPSGLRPAARKRYDGVTSASGFTGGGQTLVQVTTAGLVQCVPACSGSGQVIVLDGITFPVD